MIANWDAHKQREDGHPPWEVTEAPEAEPTDNEYPDPTSDEDDEHSMMPYPGHPSWTGTETPPPWVTQTKWPPETLSTAYNDLSTLSAAPENGLTSGSPTPAPISNHGPPPSSTDDPEGLGNPQDSDWGDKKGSNHGAMYAAAGIVPVVLLIIGAVAFFYVRKRKRQRAQIAATQARVSEMKMRNQPTVQPFMAPSPVEPHYTAPPSHPPPPATPPTPAIPQPIILGPIQSGSNGAYFTGIDTSDAVSVNDRTGLGDPFADGNSLQEEPPPPYRPRSIAPLSRDTSLRVPPVAATAASSQTHLIDANGQPVRSPFADPQDDDSVSVISGPTTRRHPDAMSDVSDLSYQADPVMTRPTV